MDIFTELYSKPDLKFHHVDSQQVDLSTLGIADDENLWIVTNPPYGERLSSEQIPAILKRFEALKMLQGMVILHPADWKFSFNKIQLTREIPFTNQGLKLSLSIYKRI